MTKRCIHCFKILSDNTRAHIVREIRRRPMNVRAVHSLFSLTQPTITHHLQALHAAGIVEREKKGREVVYSFNRTYPCKKCGVFTFAIKT